MNKKELTFYEPAIVESTQKPNAAPSPAPGQRAVPKQKVTEAVYPTHQQPQRGGAGKPPPPEAPPPPGAENGRFAVKGFEEFDGVPVRVLPSEPPKDVPPSDPGFSFDLEDSEGGQGQAQGQSKAQNPPPHEGVNPSWRGEAYAIPAADVQPEPHPLDIIFDQIRHLTGEGQAYPRREDFTREFKDRAGGGRMFLLPLDEERIFIIRPLRRIEWMKVMEKFQSQRGYTDEDAKHEVVKACLYWPKIADVRWGQMEAGLIETLYAAIRQQSFFLSEEQVNAITMKL